MLDVAFWASAIGSSSAVELAESSGFGSDGPLLPPLAASAGFLMESSSLSLPLVEASPPFFDLPAFFYNFFFGTISRNFSDFEPDEIVVFGNKVWKFCWKLLISHPFFGR